VATRPRELRIEPQFYSLDYLEELCERTMVEFCTATYGQELVPVPTDVLTQLLQRDTSVLNLFAPLDAGINGMTTMFGSERWPRVDIASELSRQWFRENRLRTTLAHEYAHVLLHAPLWRAQCMAERQTGEALIAQACRRDTVEDHLHRSGDRIEWQAGYISGALLMPKRRVDLLVARFLSTHACRAPLSAGSADAEELVELVSIGFRVSRHAARYRLERLGVVSDEMQAGG
jgi:IrrE N-terminal-like domain